MRWAVLVLQGLYFYLMLLLLAVLSLIWNFVALVLHPFMGEESGRRVGRAGIAYGYRGYWTVVDALGAMRLDLKALDQLAAEPGGLVIVGNHPMLLDGVLVASRLPRASCIMSSKLMGNVFIGAGARFARYIQVEQPLSMIKEAVQDLKRDAQLIIFPEGTRTVGERVNPFRPGVTLIAKKANVPIQTIFIETRSPFLTKGWPILKPPPLPIEISVRLGKRFEPEADHGKLLADLEDYFVTSMRSDVVDEARVAPPALLEEVQES